MSLRPLLAYAHDDPAAAALARDGGRGVRVAVAAPVPGRGARRPSDARRPALVVAGDDRAARDLAADLRAWLRPRPVRFYPSRGVAYESHLAPPPHLVGLRVAALDALRRRRPATERAGRRRLRRRAVREGPRPGAAPARLRARVGDLLDLDESAADLVAAGYERVDQVEDRGQFAVRGGLLDVYPATEERAVRVDLFDVEIESLRWFSTFTQRSLGEAEASRSRPPPSSPPSTASWPRSPRSSDAERAPGRRRAAARRPLPRAARPAPGRRAPCWSPPTRTSSRRSRPLGGRLRGVPRRRRAPPLRQPRGISAALDARAARPAVARSPATSRSSSAPRPPTLAARSLSEAEPELEKLVRSGYRTVVTWPQPRRGRARRVQPRARSRRAGSTARAGATAELAFADGAPARRLRRAAASSSPSIPEHRLHPPPARAPSAPGAPRPRRCCARSPTCAPATSSSTRTTASRASPASTPRRSAGVTRDYLDLEFQGDDKVFMPVDQLAKISRYVGADGEHPPLSQARRHALGARSRRAPAAPRRSSPASCSTSTPSASRRARPRLPEPTPTGCASSRPRSRTARRPTSATRSRRSRPTWRRARPMDRLICGDVGYGKTEVALRAAFKAADDGKQVLMLVPTTILAQQHFGTFSERLRDYPFTIEHVSRFRPAARAARGGQALRRGQGRHPHRHPPPALARRAREGPRACSSSTRSSASASSRRSCCASSS